MVKAVLCMAISVEQWSAVKADTLIASPTNEFIQIKSQELEATTISLNPQKKENDENLSP